MAKRPKRLGGAVGTVVVWNNIGNVLEKLWRTWKLLSDKLQKGLGKLKNVPEEWKWTNVNNCSTPKRREKKNSIWVEWEQSLPWYTQILARTSRANWLWTSFADTQVDSEIKISKRQKDTVLTAEFTIDPEVFHSCILQKETAAANRRQHPQFAKISKAQLCISNSDQKF